MPKKKLTKREDGKRLNEEGRLSPLEVLQERMEYHRALANEEAAKGSTASNEVIAHHMLAAQAAAVELAPYRHPKLQATTVAHSTTSDLEKLLREIEGLDQGPLPKQSPFSQPAFDEPPPKIRH